MSAPTATDRELPSVEALAERLDGVLERSPADETELVWLEAWRGRATGRGRDLDVRRTPQRTVMVRVLDRGRVGSYRTGSAEPGELDAAVRQAIAQSRAREPLAGLPHLPPDEGRPATVEGLYDPRLARLTPEQVERSLSSLLERREEVDFTWTDARVVVSNSRGLRRGERVTAASIAIRCGRRPGVGSAADAGRRQDRLHPNEVAERARSRHAAGTPIEPPPPGEARPVLLAPEATIELVDLLAGLAFSAKSYYDGTTFLREHLGVQVFDRSLDLVDDGTDPAGIPFPFDLEGTPKSRVELIAKGAPKTPTLDHRQAAVLGLQPTAHAVGGNDARAQNLFLVAGEATDEELLRSADGGFWIGGLDAVEVAEPRRVELRALATGVRAIRGGRLAEPVPDLLWEDSLLRALGSLVGIGRDPRLRLTPDGFLGGVSAPAIVLGSVEGLRAAR